MTLVKSPVTLIPLSTEQHIDVLQDVYAATPRYWAMYDLAGAPAGQAGRDLAAAEATPGRSMLGITQRLVRDDPQAGLEMVGVVDLRLQWPKEEIAYLGMLMVAESHQRRGIGSRAWQLLRPWLVNQESIQIVRVGVEQFNPGALAFFQQLGFALTGDADRVAVGEKFVRLLYMDRALGER